MKIIWIALNDLRLAARDKKGLLLLLAMPLLLIAILGSAFGRSFNTAPVVSAISVGIVDYDNGMLSQSFQDTLASDDLKKLIKPVALTEAEAREQITSGKLSSAVVIPQGFSESVMSGEPLAMEVLKDQSDTFNSTIIQSICQSFVNHVTAIRTARYELSTTKSKNGQIANNFMQNPATYNALMAQITASVNINIPTSIEELSNSSKPPSAMQYYSAAMGVMFLLFSGITGMQSIGADRREKTFARTLATATSPIEYLLGKFFGIVAIAFSQFIILAIGTTLAFSVDWGPPMEVLLIAFAYAWAVSGMALALSAWVSNIQAATGAWSIVVQMFSALGGSMIPLTIFPPAMLTLAHFTPNYWGLQGLLTVMQYGSFPWSSMLTLLALGLVTLIAGSFKIRV